MAAIQRLARRHELAELERAKGKYSAARVKFTLAGDAFDELGAAPFAARTRAAKEELDLLI